MLGLGVGIAVGIAVGAGVDAGLDSAFSGAAEIAFSNNGAARSSSHSGHRLSERQGLTQAVVLGTTNDVGILSKVGKLDPDPWS